MPNITGILSNPIWGGISGLTAIISIIIAVLKSQENKSLRIQLRNIQSTISTNPSAPGAMTIQGSGNSQKGGTVVRDNATLISKNSGSINIKH